ncbi:MAG: hypothetical protein IPP97_23525 [Candidatus Obscuribacter sp.]|nr:hypothetical protein [Candidatus Obscuribacter sp.]
MTFRMLVCFLFATLIVFFCGDVANAITEAECLEAIEVGNELIKENPNSYRGYASRGGAYGYLKKYDLAEKDLLKAISLSQSFAALYVHLASVYFETKQYEKAVAASRKAVELGADYQESYDALLANLCSAKRYEECLKTCDEVLVKFPNDASAYFFKAISKSELGTFASSEVMSDLVKAHSLKPEDGSINVLYDRAQAGKSIKLIDR